VPEILPDVTDGDGRGFIPAGRLPDEGLLLTDEARGAGEDVRQLRGRSCAFARLAVAGDFCTLISASLTIARGEVHGTALATSGAVPFCSKV
jgi:hypothetical protein